MGDKIMSKSILDEAMEDAKLLKETAVENAKNVLLEAISPQIKEFVDEQLGESEMDLDAEDEEEKEPESTDEGMYEVKDDEEVEEEGFMHLGEADDEEPKDTDELEEEVVEITQEDLKQAFSEVLGDIKSEATVTKAFGDVEDPTPKVAGGKQQTGIADEKGGEHHWKDEEAPAAEDHTIPEAAYKRKIAKLVEANKAMGAQLEQYKEACQYLKRNLQEVNLFNSKLLYTNKLIQSANLNNQQRLGVIEQFDRAANLREVELVYKSLSESLKIAGVLGESKKSQTSKTPKSSRLTTRGGVLAESVDKGNSAESYTERMQRLSGLID
jgi:hypothetical protein